MSDSKKDYSSLTFEEMLPLLGEIAFPYVYSNLADGWEDNPFENEDSSQLKEQLLKTFGPRACMARIPNIEQEIETLVNRLQQNRSSPSDSYVREESLNLSYAVLNHWIETVYECLETNGQINLNDCLIPVQLDSEQEKEYDEFLNHILVNKEQFEQIMKQYVKRLFSGRETVQLPRQLLLTRQEDGVYSVGKKV